MLQSEITILLILYISISILDRHKFTKVEKFIDMNNNPSFRTDVLNYGQDQTAILRILASQIACLTTAIKSFDGSHIEDIAIINITMRRVANSPNFDTFR
jgi:hypothetical protein